jgi:hypothetical protein
MIEVLHFSGCPNHEPTVELVREVSRELGLDEDIREVVVETAEAHRLVGSPSVRVDGRDIKPAARGQSEFSLSCRMYGQAGVPPKDLLVKALRETS